MLKNIDFSSAMKNIKRNIFLLLSAIAALSVFILPSLMALVLIAVIYAIVVAAVALDIVKPVTIAFGKIQVASIFLSIIISYIGLDTFKMMWSQSSKVAELASVFNLTASTFLLLIGVAACILGFYAMYTLSYGIVSLFANFIIKYLPVQEKPEMVANLKRNWYFLISAFAFLCLHINKELGRISGLLIAFLIIFGVCSQISSIVKCYFFNHKVTSIVSFFCAVGICLAEQDDFFRCWGKDGTAYFIGIGLFVIAIPFICFCVIIFWDVFLKIARKYGLFSGIKPIEWVIYAVIFVLLLGTMIFSFVNSEAFYGTMFFDIIYTSDSPMLIRKNAYLTLMHQENDLRQPLFAVFSAPFTGIPFLLSRVFGGSLCIRAILMHGVQIVMMLAANFMLAKTLKLNSLKRICFMVFTACTYTQLLFTLMLEQYIIAYFWLVLCLFMIVENHHSEYIAFCGAGGTLLTSMALLPFMSDKTPLKNFKEWFADIVNCVIGFIICLLAFCRFDVIFSSILRMFYLSGFTKKNIPFIEKIYQYTEFVKNCFAAPDAGVNTTALDHSAWSLDIVVGINLVGVFLLVLSIFSAIWNRDKKSSLLALYWIVFSFIMLVVLGWGAQENGLTLYSLYFGWAFIVLLFQLVEKIEDKLKIKFLIPIITAFTVVALLAINIPAIMEMIDFAITYYPV